MVIDSVHFDVDLDITWTHKNGNMQSVTISALTQRTLTSALAPNPEVHIYLKGNINLKKTFGKENLLFSNIEMKIMLATLS